MHFYFHFSLSSWQCHFPTKMVKVRNLPCGSNKIKRELIWFVLRLLLKFWKALIPQAVLFLHQKLYNLLCTLKECSAKRARGKTIYLLSKLIHVRPCKNLQGSKCCTEKQKTSHATSAFKSARNLISTRNIEKPSFTLANAKTFGNIPHEKLSLSCHACFTSPFFIQTVPSGFFSFHNLPPLDMYTCAHVRELRKNPASLGLMQNSPLALCKEISRACTFFSCCERREVCKRREVPHSLEGSLSNQRERVWIFLYFEPHLFSLVNAAFLAFATNACTSETFLLSQRRIQIKWVEGNSFRCCSFVRE